MINSQKFTMILGVILVVFHVGMLLSLLYLFGLDGRVNVSQISAPVTAAYFTAIVAWFCETKGIVTRPDVIGIPFIAVTSIVVGGMMIGLVGSVYVYLEIDQSMTPSQLENIFMYIEGAFGGVFGLLISTLFKTDKATN